MFRFNFDIPDMNSTDSDPCYWKDVKLTRTVAIHGAIIIALDIIPALLTITGNIIFITTLIKTRSLHVPSNVFLGALCLSDLLVGFIVQPIYLTFNVMLILNKDLHLIRIVSRYAVTVVSGLSFVFASFVTADRYIAICYPFTYGRNATCTRFMRLSIIAGFVYAVISAAVLIKRNNYFEAMFMLYAILTLVGIIVSYARIYRVILKRKRSVVTIGTLSDEESKEIENRKREKDKTYMIALILGFLILCYMPTFLMAIAAIIWKYELCTSHDSTATGSLWVAFFVLINSCINPLIYCVRSTEIRTAAKKIFYVKYFDNNMAQMDHTSQNGRTYGTNTDR